MLHIPSARTLVLRLSATPRHPHQIRCDRNAVTGNSPLLSGKRFILCSRIVLDEALYIVQASNSKLQHRYRTHRTNMRALNSVRRNRPRSLSNTHLLIQGLGDRTHRFEDVNTTASPDHAPRLQNKVHFRIGIHVIQRRYTKHKFDHSTD